MINVIRTYKTPLFTKALTITVSTSSQPILVIAHCTSPFHHHHSNPIYFLSRSPAVSSLPNPVASFPFPFLLTL